MAADLGRTSNRMPVVVGVRIVVVAAVAFVVGAVHVPGRPRTLCTLRSLTGVPCPFCGGTTAVVELGHARFADAIAASPLAVALMAALPLRGVASIARWEQRRSVRWTLLATVIASAELWQLHRFGLLFS